MVSIGKYRSVDRRPTSRNKTRNRICPVIFTVNNSYGVFLFFDQSDSIRDQLAITLEEELMAGT
jgi:hypothetical protein